MKRAAFILATVATLGVTAVAAPAPAEARGGFGPGLAGGLIAGALIGGVASNAYGYGPGYGYGYVSCCRFSGRDVKLIPPSVRTQQG